MTARRIALLGAESTGKTRLSEDLAAHLRGRGLHAVAVPEALRAWCARAGRAPRPEEQLAIAQAQERQVDDAAAAGAQFVVADTTALMVLAYSGMLFEDDPLYRFAFDRQRGYDATLVTGLDLPWTPDGLQRDAAQPREPVDALVRTLLQRAGVPFQVVYGSGPQRLAGAVAALAGILPPEAADRGQRERETGPWIWSCEKCSDPECEHRLFSRLRS
ncbi:MAG: ATPase [Comamonadaceae bacterium]|nr:MAG: ATPase [Comamonadaceae bacterium]